MPVDDHPIHHSTIKTDFRAGCYNRPPASDGYWVPTRLYRPDGSFVMSEKYITHTLTRICRQVGRKVNGVWEDLPECVGCTAQRDWQYIMISRKRI